MLTCSQDFGPGSPPGVVGGENQTIASLSHGYGTPVPVVASVNLSEMERSSWVCAVVTVGIPGMSPGGFPPAGAILDLAEFGQDKTLHTFYLTFERRREGPATWSSAPCPCSS